MNYCFKCQSRFANHATIVDNQVYCSPGCYVGDKHTGWIGRMYRSLDGMNGVCTVRQCKGGECCKAPRPRKHAGKKFSKK